VSYALYVTHPEVILDASVPSTRWHLSPYGRERAATFAKSAAMQPIKLIISSAETKTMETAGLLAAAGAELVAGEHFHENDRSSTGVVPNAEFEGLLNALYAEPELSPRGWESAVVAAARVIAATMDAIARYGGRAPLAFVGHGTVGTLLKCHLAGRPATRDEDQRRMAHPGGGNVFAFSLSEIRLLSDWTAMEDFCGPSAA
jgi:broad specificity phosphatase PhoE